MHGADADDLVIRVPVGTCVYDDETGNIIADLTKRWSACCNRKKVAVAVEGMQDLLHHVTQHPRFVKMANRVKKFNLRVELKLLADVGLVGFPSVGKSTLLSVVSKARPQIADYHFTTIVPNLGVVQVKDGRSFVMADLPGLIEGASQGKGLGHQFLRHIERCRVIVHVIDMSGSEGRDPYEDYVTINKELGEYEYRLLERPQIIVANKMDGDEAEENLKKFKEKLGDQKVFPNYCTNS